MLSAVLSVVVAVVCAVLFSVAFHMFVRLLLSLWWRLRPPRTRPSWGRTSDAEDLSLVRGVTRAPPRNVTCLLSVRSAVAVLFVFALSEAVAMLFAAFAVLFVAAVALCCLLLCCMCCLLLLL